MKITDSVSRPLHTYTVLKHKDKQWGTGLMVIATNSCGSDSRVGHFVVQMLQTLQ